MLHSRHCSQTSAGIRHWVQPRSVHLFVSSFNRRVPQICPSTFLWNELKTQLAQYPTTASPAELRALLTRVYHTTWTGSRWMFEKMGNVWVRRLKACVAAKGGFFE